MISCDSYIKKDGKFECNALKVNMCEGDKCAFYISKQDARKKRDARYKRLRSLTPAHQQNISEVYYLGLKPWL